MFDVSITPNRGDCLSIAGIAREVATLNVCTVTAPEMKAASVDDSARTGPTVSVAAPLDCPRYIGRMLSDINPAAVTPIQIVERLRRGGIRSISPVVDVANYVMLELGQPLHGFDAERIQGDVVVRRARADEQLTLLDGRTVTLDEATLIIADGQQPLAIAGVMGGLDSGVTAATRHVFLESAFFSPLVVAGRARHYGVQSDASYRFERGVDPALQERAIERATQLLLSIVGGKAGPLVHSVASSPSLPKSVAIDLRRSTLHATLGVIIADADIERILTSLGIQLKTTTEGWQAAAPSYRFDLAIEADLIEEVARIYGYHRILAKPFKMAGDAGELSRAYSETRIPLSRIRQTLVDLGYQEAITYSFVDPATQQALEPTLQALSVVNPISPEMSVMRTTLWAGLLPAVRYNLNRQQTRVRLFEMGLRFLKKENGELVQEPMLSGCIAGSLYPKQWSLPERAVDFFDIKGDVEALVGLSKRAAEFRYESAKTEEHSALHPGQCCRIIYGNDTVGYVGRLHPVVAERLGLSVPVYVFELSLAALTTVQLPQYKVVSKYPAIRRDLAFFMARSIPGQAVCDKVREVAGEWLVDVQIFDVYQGQGVLENEKSLALSLVLQHPERTLIDAEINAVVDGVIQSLQDTFEIKLRDAVL